MKFKTILGITLIVLSLLGMYLWETRIREKMIFTEVLAAACDLEEGDVAGRDSFKEIRVSSESLVSGYLSVSDAEKLYGKVCRYPLKKNAQVFIGAFGEKKEEEDDGRSDVVLLPSWIAIKNEDIAMGDELSVYSLPTAEYLGTYRVRDVCENGSIEIRCSLEDYFQIMESLEKEKGNSLLLIRGDR